ncbi:hypothetical protein AXF42_Ash014851 [Apostasia shenzhenica]|uniref:Uncharacterized protein n=1 Tax=Apostasia shenzhenica TaxID=1088818 RepID=A0A2I0ALA5_9ASPA|nr:hypothetical protein AXF42_Ash014851 [Apostasia shenzhenica]
MKKSSLEGLYSVIFGKKKEEKKRALQLELSYNNESEEISYFLTPLLSPFFFLSLSLYLLWDLFSGICSCGSAWLHPSFSEKKAVDKLWVRAACWPPERSGAVKGE